jgi:hypothetical protein
MRPCQAHVATATQPLHMGPLRDSGFNAGAPCRFSGVLHRLLPLAPRFERERGVFGTKSDGPSLRAFARAHALAPTRTGLAILHGALDLHDGRVAVVDRWCPTAPGMPFRADRLLLVPVNRAALGVKALLLAGLPLHIWASRPQQISPILLLASGQEFGIQVAGIYQMNGREHVFGLQRLAPGEPAE